MTAADPRSLSGADIPGDYQYRALYQGHPIQQAWHQAKLELIKTVAFPSGESIVLDAGCGSGVVANFLARTCAKAVGVDLNRRAVEFARRTFSQENVEFVESSLLDFHRDGFDLIYSFECIEHFHREEVVRLLRHLRRLILPRGRLLVTTPNYRGAWPLIELVLDLFRLTPKLHSCQHLSPITPARLKRSLISGGWSILEMGSFNGIAPFLAPFSSSLTSLMQKWELRHRTRLHRNLLYALCEAASE